MKRILTNVNNYFTQFYKKTIDSFNGFFYIYLCKTTKEVTMNLQQVNHFIMTNTNIEVLDLIIQEAKERIHNLANKNKKVAKPKKVAVKVEEKKEENVWDKMTDKQKIEHLKKLMNNGSGKKNPLTGNKLVDDATEIEMIGDRFMKVIHRLEDYWYNKDMGDSSEFDDFTDSYQDDIIKDVLNGGKINEMVKEYKECM